MNRSFQVLAGLILLGILSIAGFIAIIEILWARSNRQVREIVAVLPSGTSFSAATNRLGKPGQSLTNEIDIRVFGTSKDEELITNSILHTFGHTGPPYRWIIIYTDKASEKVLHADFKDL